MDSATISLWGLHLPPPLHLHRDIKRAKCEARERTDEMKAEAEEQAAEMEVRVRMRMWAEAQAEREVKMRERSRSTLSGILRSRLRGILKNQLTVMLRSGPLRCGTRNGPRGKAGRRSSLDRNPPVSLRWLSLKLLKPCLPPGIPSYGTGFGKTMDEAVGMLPR